MREYLVCEVTDNYGIFLCHARRFTEEEKMKYVKEYRELGFVGLSGHPHIELKGIRRWDVTGLLNRESDGSFNGCGNSAYIVTEQEWNKLIELNNQIVANEKREKILEDIEFYKMVIGLCEKQKKLYTKEESTLKAKEWSRIHNEDGEGYVPYFYTVDEYENAKQMLKKLSNDLIEME